MIHRQTPGLLLLGMVVFLPALFFAGCTPIVRERTLPASVRSVYVPMIENRTQASGLEERFTVDVQKELLADGRLSLVREKDADAIVRVIITRFDEVPMSFDSDDFATRKTFEVEATVEVQENIPGRPSIGGPRQVAVSQSYNDDTRSTGFQPEVRERQKLSESFARAVVLELITGQFEVEPGASEPTGPEKEDPNLSVNVGT